jgi:hypothetical protein
MSNKAIGSGIATWTTDRVALYLASCSLNQFNSTFAFLISSAQ